jgi:N-acetylmuramoyl-L-alanine amidase
LIHPIVSIEFPFSIDFSLPIDFPFPIGSFPHLAQPLWLNDSILQSIVHNKWADPLGVYVETGTMGRIFLSAAHGGIEQGVVDPGSVVAGTTEAREMMLTRDLVITELRSRNLDVLAVPDDLSLKQSLDWINVRARRDDIALEIHADATANVTMRGTSVYYLTNNDERKQHAQLLLQALVARIPQLPSRGPLPDTTAGLGNLAFCRQLVCPSLLWHLGFLSNSDDRFILQNRRRELAQGIADGLSRWLQGVSGTAPAPQQPVYAAISININGQNYGELGIIVSGNSYIPIDLIDSLGIDLSKDPNVRRVTYRNVVYAKAIELRDYNISVGWDSVTRTVILRTILRFCPGALDRIMGHGSTTRLQLELFLKSGNADGLNQFTEIAELYRQEAAIEGINYDIAFSQMCLETNFLRFGGVVKPSQNNFAGLGSVGGGPEGASFDSPKIGIRAHIQHLKAYASTELLVQDLVDPRFRFVTRGIAPLVGQLSGRWSADLDYGDRVLALLRRLYELAKLL